MEKKANIASPESISASFPASPMKGDISPGFCSYAPPTYQEAGSPLAREDGPHIYIEAATQQTSVVEDLNVGHFAFETECLSCGEYVRTSVRRHIGVRTHIAALLLGLVSALGCCLVYVYVRKEFAQAHIFLIYFPYLVACFLFFLCFVPTVCVPYCLPDCKNARHTCPKCQALIGTHPFTGRIWCLQQYP